MYTRIICLRVLLSIGVAALAVLPGITFAGSEMVDVCHLPPANLVNFHTITIGDKAVPAHLDHGDLDALLASFGDDESAESSGSDDEMDPEHAALR